jgi:choline-sulfatase
MTMEGWRKAWAVYLGMVKLLDDQIGRVLNVLEQRGFLENALVIFTSDHGEMLGSHRMFQKMCMYEEAVRVPFWLRPPDGRGAGERRTGLSQHLDLAATVCDYAGVPPPDHNAGQSMRGSVEGASDSGCERVFIEFNGNSGRSYQQRAIVTPAWKYIHNHGFDPEFYHTAGDPLEAQNLCIAEPESKTACSLRDELTSWMRATQDPLPTPT